MRILFLHSIGRKKYGGGERWVINAASGLQMQGHSVIVGSLSNSVMLSEARKRGLGTAVFHIFSDFNVIQAYLISRFIRKNKIDVVICKGREVVIGALAARWGGKPLVIRRTGSPPSPKSRKLVWRTKGLVDGVVTNTETIRKIYLEKGFTQENFVKVIYNGLDIDDQVVPHDFSLVFPGRKIVLCIGRAVGHKGYFHLIDALPSIKASRPELFFYIIGDGKDKQRLMDYARSRNVDDMIHFAGYIHEPVSFIKGCDLFLHPSLYEGMPNAPMEAMGYGKPVIMTRVNGADELSMDGRYAILIPPADAKAISDAVLYAVTNLEKVNLMGQEAQNHVRVTYGMQTMVKSLENYILERMQSKTLLKN